jgi:hypothetical protein
MRSINIRMFGICPCMKELHYITKLVNCCGELKNIKAHTSIINASFCPNSVKLAKFCITLAIKVKVRDVLESGKSLIMLNSFG